MFVSVSHDYHRSSDSGLSKMRTKYSESSVVQLLKDQKLTRLERWPE